MPIEITYGEYIDTVHTGFTFLKVDHSIINQSINDIFN